MQYQSSPDQQNKAKQRIHQLRQRIIAFDHVCSGTVVTTTTRCGKPTCRCATDPAAKHGPYHQWNRMKEGKLAHSTVSSQQAEKLIGAIGNYRQIQGLLREWEEQTATLLGVKSKRKKQSREK